MAKRDKRQRQTFPGPNPSENQQMLNDIRTTLGTNAQATSTASTASDREGSADPAQAFSTDKEPREDRESCRRSPPSDRELTGASPSNTPRMQVQRSSNRTPTKQLTSHGTKEKLREIKKSLGPFAYSDPGFHHPAQDKVNKAMLLRLISLGYNEVRMIMLLLSVCCVSKYV